MTNWLVKQLPERGDIVIVAGSDEVKNMCQGQGLDCRTKDC